MNEDNIKEETILDEEKTDDAQSNETNESAEDSNENNSDSPENIIEKLNEEIQDLKDQRLRAAAELENFRKRAEKDQADALKYGVSNFAKEIINIKDNVERAQSSISEDVRSNDAVKSIVEGLDMIAQSAVATFEKIGIKKNWKFKWKIRSQFTSSDDGNRKRWSRTRNYRSRVNFWLYPAR